MQGLEHGCRPHALACSNNLLTVRVHVVGQADCCADQGPVEAGPQALHLDQRVD